MDEPVTVVVTRGGDERRCWSWEDVTAVLSDGGRVKPGYPDGPPMPGSNSSDPDPDPDPAFDQGGVLPTGSTAENRTGSAEPVRPSSTTAPRAGRSSRPAGSTDG